MTQYPCTILFLLLMAGILYACVSHRVTRKPWTARQINVLIFLVIWAIYLSNFRWRGSGDVVAASLQPFALFRQGNLYLDNFYHGFLDDEAITWVYHARGHVLSMYPSAAGLLLTPVYAPYALAGAVPTDLLIHQLQKIGASLMVAFSAYLLLLVLSDLVKRRWAILLTFAYALGTESWSTSSQAIWQHGPGQLFICVGLYGMLKSERRRGWILLSGFGFAMAAWCRYTNALFYGIMALYVLAHRRRTLGYFLLGSVPPAAAILLDNYFHSGNLFKTGYQASAVQFHAPLWEGLTGLLVSPARGLFLYSPFLLFSVWGFVRAWTQPGYRAWRYFAAACAIYLLAYSRYTYWSGGWCFGPRYLAELSPFLILAIAPLAPVLEQSRRARTLFNFLLGVAVLVQGLGAYLTWWWEANPPQLWSWSSYPVTYLLSRLL